MPDVKKYDRSLINLIGKKKLAERVGKAVGSLFGYAMFTTVLFLVLGKRTRNGYILVAGIAIAVISLGAILERWLKR